MGGLEWIRDSIRGLPGRASPNRYIYSGLVAGDYGGMARNGGRTSPTAGNVAWVSTNPANVPLTANDPEYFGSIWAQEIAHLFGRMHASNMHGEAGGGPVDCQYPTYGNYFGHGGIGNNGVDFNNENWD